MVPTTSPHIAWLRHTTQHGLVMGVIDGKMEERIMLDSRRMTRLYVDAASKGFLRQLHYCQTKRKAEERKAIDLPIGNKT